MPRVMFFSYEFPPKGGTQSQHVVKFVAGLARMGWDVTVITVDDPPTTLVDTSLAEELPASVDVCRAYSLEPTRVVQWLRAFKGSRGAGPSASGDAGTVAGTAADARQSASGRAQAGDHAPNRAPRGYTSMPLWAIRLVQSVFLPDEKIGWKPWALRVAANAHRARPADVILSSGPPFSAHSIARAFARRHRLPWVVDLRDPILGNYFFLHGSSPKAAFMRHFEYRVVSDSSAVLVATEGMRAALASRYPRASRKVITVVNGYDAEDFVRCGETSATPGFTVSYVGTFQHTIRPDVFLEGVARLRASDEGFRRDARIRFIGPMDSATEDAVRRFGLDDLVERTGFVSHERAIEAMCASAALLLVLGPEPESALILTSKLPEYLAAHRPVLALVPEGVAADVVRRADAGHVVHPEDRDGVTSALREMYEEWKAGAPFEPVESVVREFDRAELMKRINEVLQDAMDREPAATGGRPVGHA